MTADRRVISAECSEILDGDGAVAQPGEARGHGSPRVSANDVSVPISLHADAEPRPWPHKTELRVTFNI